jgi:hypothetical protein
MRLIPFKRLRTTDAEKGAYDRDLDLPCVR